MQTFLENKNLIYEILTVTVVWFSVLCRGFTVSKFALKEDLFAQLY